MAMPSPRPNIPRAKREGLDLDLEAVCAAGPDALQPDDHYRLKTYGVCTQRQDDRFMVRLRIAAGRLDHSQVLALADAARAHAGGWVHLTTRQNIELHSVELGDVPDLYRRLEPHGLVGRSACGHTIRNVVACPEAATSTEEPFDVGVDARWLSELLVARSSELNVALPSRLNISLGGCTECGLEARVNDIGLVACLREGVPGYQLWAGGSLGTAPRLSLLLRPFLRREEIWPAVWALVEWFCEEGDIDEVARGRLKFVIERHGEAAFRKSFSKRFAALLAAEHQVPPAVVVPEAQTMEQPLGRAPLLGWGRGIRPEREPGYASITVRVPLGDLLAEELEAISALAPRGAVLSRDQNIVLTGIPVDEVAAIVAQLSDLALGPGGARGALDVRACPGLAFCALAITASQPVAVAVERALAARPDLPADLSIAVSGCPNSCAKQQVADIGLAGSKLKLNGKVGLGYQVFLGADLAAGAVGEPVVKVAESEVPAAIVAAVETWSALRRPGEIPGATFRRLGFDVVARAITSRVRGVEVVDRAEEDAA